MYQTKPFAKDPIMSNIFYSFRRCPYAIRARLAIAYSQQSVCLREVVLKHKPQEMIALSEKATVPVLQLSNGDVIDESLEIMVWALEHADPNGWLTPDLALMLELIDENDFEFKHWLDKYKYSDRFPEHPVSYYQQRADDFLFKLEAKLHSATYLFGDNISLADIAIFPFIRQFASVDKTYFEQLPYRFLKSWLKRLTTQPLFISVMDKYPQWVKDSETFIFPKKLK